MKLPLLDVLRCPACLSTLALDSHAPAGAFGDVMEGALRCNPRQSFDTLLRLVRPVGAFVSDVYRKSWKRIFWGQNCLSALTRRIPRERLSPFIERYFVVVHAFTGLLLPINSHLSKEIRLLLGTADYRGLYPMRPEVMRRMVPARYLRQAVARVRR